MQSRVVDPKTKNVSEEEFETSLRPQSFDEIIGREQEKKNLKIMIESAKKRNKAIDHVLFHGPPGLGKTTFGYVIAKELGVSFHITNGSVIEKPGDLAAILTSLEDFSILFIDEIHRLRVNIEEILYPAMEDRALDILIGKGPNAKTLRLDLPQFTIIGATTKISMLSAPLRDRFGMNFRLDFYSEDELRTLVGQKAGLMRFSIGEEAAMEISRRSRMTPRIAIRILKRVRDLATVKSKKIADLSLVKETLEMLDIDENGLDSLDRSILKVIMNNFDNKPVGLNTLAVAISEEQSTIETVYEPYLIKKGFLKRTPRGRVVTQNALDYYSNTLFRV